MSSIYDISLEEIERFLNYFHLDSPLDLEEKYRVVQEYLIAHQELGFLSSPMTDYFRQPNHQDQDLSFLELLPKDLLWLIGMRLDCFSLMVFSRLSRRLWNFFGETRELPEMVRFILQETTRLNLSQYTKGELDLVARMIRSQQTMATGECHALLLNSQGQIFGMGSNEYNQLSPSRDKYFSRPSIIETISTDQIIAISTGAFHSLFLDSQGQVFGCGYNPIGQLGLDENKEKQTFPCLIKGLWPDQITAISAGAGHSLVLNFQGRVYSFGYNGHGQLGLGKKGNKDSPTLIPISCPQMEEIIAISAGTFHSLILNDQGQVLSFGANKDGRLGLGDQKGRLAPTLIESFEKIDPPGSARVVAISAGGRHSLFLTHQGQVFSCGYNRYGQLGLSDDASRLVPTLIDSLENRKIIAISAGGTHSLLLDSRGRVFSFGNNHYGQLGLKKNGRNLLSCPDKVCLPTKINLTIEIVGISTGISYSLFLDSQGRIFSCGNNGSGQLGLGDEILRLAPTLIPDFVI